MEGNDNMLAWGYYDSYNGLNFVSYLNGDRKPKFGGHEAFISSSNGRLHNREYGSPTPHLHPSEYNLPEAYLPRDNKFYNMLPTECHSYVPTENPQTNHHPVHILRQLDTSNEERMVQAEPSSVDINSGPLKKRSAGKFEKLPKPKKQKKASSVPKDGGSGSAQRAKSAKKTIEVVINGIDMDISSIPIPVCSCTGAPQQCYRWGFGGWQSACCTTGMSMYPLPMSTKRRGARIAGRKMSLGAFKKVLEKLAAEGYNFSNPINLRTHWAKHGTNKFVTIR